MGLRVSTVLGFFRVKGFLELGLLWFRVLGFRAFRVFRSVKPPKPIAYRKTTNKNNSFKQSRVLGLGFSFWLGFGV